MVSCSRSNTSAQVNTSNGTRLPSWDGQSIGEVLLDTDYHLWPGIAVVTMPDNHHLFNQPPSLAAGLRLSSEPVRLVDDVDERLAVGEATAVLEQDRLALGLVGC